MSLKTKLLNIITREVKLDDIYKLAIEDRFYKIGTIDRELRRLTEEKKIAPLTKKNYITHYLPVYVLKELRRPVLSQIKGTEDIDSLIKDFKPEFGNPKHIKIQELMGKLKKPDKGYHKNYIQELKNLLK